MTIDKTILALVESQGAQLTGTLELVVSLAEALAAVTQVCDRQQGQIDALRDEVQTIKSFLESEKAAIP